MPEPFNLEAFKAGRLAVDSVGGRYKFVAHVPEALSHQRVVAISHRYIAVRGEDGRRFNGSTSPEDLLLADEEKRWFDLPDGLVESVYLSWRDGHSFANTPTRQQFTESGAAMRNLDWSDGHA